MPIRLFINLVFLITAQTACLQAADGEAAPETPAALAPVRQVTNTAGLAAVHAFAQSKGLSTSTYGNGAFRILAVGGTPPEPEQLVKDGELVLGGLEIWTGKQNLFVPEELSEEKVFWYVLLKDDQTFDAFLSHARKIGVVPKPEGEDISKSSNNTWSDRMAITEITKVSRGGIHRNITVYLATGLALRTFISERAPENDKELPKWLLAGMQSELEKRICDSNRCYSISYEKSSVNLAGQDWGKAVAALIKKKSDKLLKASSVMQIDLISSPAEHYLQLWSLAAFVREQAGPGRKGKPGFADLLDRIAREGDSEKAVFDQLKTDDRTLTMAWFRWASNPR